ncbi:MAG TPA: bifunctional adenosylcobinamide kinase/adenosylcobinamide-phosphate guanylyltransferase [Nitriliruptorales bacterium]
MSLIVLVGGRKSGKSSLAARLAHDTVAPVTFVACADVQDDEFAARVARHRADRPASWVTLETFDVAAVLADTPGTIIVDALDTWLLHEMESLGLWTEEPADEAVANELLDRVAEIARAAADRPPLTVVVAGTVGDGIHPMGVASRRYLDLHGLALQALADRAERVLVTVAGRVIDAARFEELP